LVSTALGWLGRNHFFLVQMAEQTPTFWLQCDSSIYKGINGKKSKMNSQQLGEAYKQATDRFSAIKNRLSAEIYKDDRDLLQLWLDRITCNRLSAVL
jgi:hypothetical protein